MEPPLPGIKMHPGEEDKEKPSSPKTQNSNISDTEKPHPEPESNDNEINAVVSRSSSSSSSSSSSVNDKPHADLSVLTPEPPDAPMWSMVSASPRGGSGLLSSSTEGGFSRTPEWVMSSISSPMKSPPLQAMGRGYDPNRIPSSIFSSKPTTPMDWSVASNESLFSIHMGNNSFSRDIGIGLEDDPGSFTPNLDPVVETPRKSDVETPRKSDVETPRKSDVSPHVYVRPGLEDEEADESPKMARKEIGGGGGDRSKEKMSGHAPIGVRLSNSSPLSDGKAPRVSNESAKSSDSFAFPVLLGMDGAKGGSIKTPPERPHTPEAHPQGSPKSEKNETTPPAAPAVGPASWFNCANCCPTWMRCC